MDESQKQDFNYVFTDSSNFLYCLMHPSVLVSRFDFKFNLRPLFAEKIMAWETKNKALNLHVV